MKQSRASIFIFTNNSRVQKMMKVLNLVRKESLMKPPKMVSRKEVPMKLVTMFAESAAE